MVQTEDGLPLGEVQAMFCIGDLWSNSSFLAATPSHRDGEVVRMVSKSRRLPVALHWSMQVEGDAVAISIELEAREAVKVQEYNLSLLSPAAYTKWRAGHEHASFPPQEDSQEWQPVNKNYEAATLLSIDGETMPALEFACDQYYPRALPTVLNTGASDNRRVAQWLCRPHGPEAFTFTPGMHRLITAHIRLAGH